ncbi:aminotransferase class V-fold PLP-dependent enzyme [Vibrio sp. J1-1]|uniref:aminotransferase class V-fold PLP-dependent enzyme n=1 Tax=Vibrio sp. J1-1 TaxID=2912251 RepID=UPI001F482982|nr:aminotransferase class V-fold PLP-dependent enzyme [Vibrio sp. J1-1]MCF7480875.1 aminotransferase class V-fold PLP-dependent enzyme [Vibrio sp. J1-1]
MSLNLEFIRRNIIGERRPINTPFGTKPLVYADYTASGRNLAFIEQFIQQQVMPYYGNTHTETSLTGRQTTQLREQSRQIIRQSLNATKEHLVIFTGSGATSAINKFIHLLDLPRYTNAKPVVFIGPYEHHSNDLPWREADVTLVRVPLTVTGELDQVYLEQKLKHYQNAPLKVGSFSAASNVTGLKSDIKAITHLLKSHGALACWDFAAAAPYMPIDLQALPIDALFISPHKFLGGPGTPGILAVRDDCFSQSIPSNNGGGTVSYVNTSTHRYVENIERREEGGTPDIVGSIRAGLAFKLQRSIGLDYIQGKEEHLVELAFTKWNQTPNLDLLGSLNLPRLAIFSFIIKGLNYGLVVAMLNDLFGIQARGGCSCAGPYAHELLAISEEQSLKIEDKLSQGQQSFRPGWVRLNLHYLMDAESIDYILDAVDLIAKYGHKLAKAYIYDDHKNLWLYQGKKPALNVSLLDVDYTQDGDSKTVVSLKHCMQQAKELLAPQDLDELEKTAENYHFTAAENTV